MPIFSKLTNIYLYHLRSGQEESNLVLNYDCDNNITYTIGLDLNIKTFKEKITKSSYVKIHFKHSNTIEIKFERNFISTLRAYLVTPFERKKIYNEVNKFILKDKFFERALDLVKNNKEIILNLDNKNGFIDKENEYHIIYLQDGYEFNFLGFADLNKIYENFGTDIVIKYKNVHLRTKLDRIFPNKTEHDEVANQVSNIKELRLLKLFKSRG